MDPRSINKYLYIQKTPTWLVRGIYLFAIFTWLLVVLGFLGAVVFDPFFRWFVGPVLLLFTIYHFISYGINLLYKQFDIGKHELLKRSYWLNRREPAIDIYLPICGESMEVLENTWRHVAQLDYRNKRVYVLDDSKDECAEHKSLAQGLGFEYFERPNKGEMKKAGNLKYAYERTSGEFIAIFDADFAPHPDFLKELLPYTLDQKVGIVQSPQYFDTSREAYKRSKLAFAAAYQEELFYRITQVARDRVNGAICCGSNALYRRDALRSIGGPRQVGASEDSRTGFAMLTKGWITRYIPVILAVGICPDNTYAYYHQQHRWCRGRSELVLSKEFRTAPVPFIIKLCNISGFMSFLLKPLEILMSFQLFWTLFFYNYFISLGGAFVFYPYIIFALIILPFMHITPFKKEVFYASVIQLYASAHSIITVMLGRSVSWIPTNAKHSSVSKAFRQSMTTVALFVFSYLVLIIFAVRIGAVHLLDYNYYTVQFWIFWNLIFSVVLLWYMYRTIERIKAQNFMDGAISKVSFMAWKIKTLGFYTALVAITTGVILLI